MRTATAKQAFLVVFICCLVLAGSNPRPSQAEPTISCPDYLIIDSRGSGEPAGEISLPGAAFASEFQRLRQDATVEVVSNAYPAVGGLLSLLKAKSRIPGNTYNRSVTKGRKWLTGKITSLQKSCEKTKLYLVGYSQGAQLTGDVYQANSFANVVGVLLFGDTHFNPDDTSTHSYGQTNLFGSLGKRGPFNDPKVQSYCHVGDPVCGWSKTSLLTNFLRMHKNYHELGEPRLAAKYFAKLEGSSISPPPAPAPVEKWPTNRNEGTVVFSMWLTVNLLIMPDWVSCDPNYCIAGSGDTVYVFTIAPSLGQIGWVRTSIADPRAGLKQVGVPEQNIDKLLAP